MSSDRPSNRPQPVRAGAAPPAVERCPVEDRFDVELTVEGGDGTRWEVRVAGRALAGRAQAGRGVDSVPELLLLAFTREGEEAPEREALVATATIRGPGGGLNPDAVRALLDSARPFEGSTPAERDFFPGTRRRRKR